MFGLVKVRPEPVGLEFRQVDDPTPASDEVIIQVRAAGVCGTDMSMYDWKSAWAKEYSPALPVVMGHECAGEVVACGRTVSDFRVGDRVAPFPILYCGKCDFCLTGRPSICTNRPMLGMGVNGVFANYVAVRDRNVYHVPENISWEVAALNELMCVALHAVDRVSLAAGETVFIAGPGPVGFAIAAAAIGSGAAQVVMSGLKADRKRLDLAESMGVITVEADSDAPMERILAATDRQPVDVAFEASGHPDGFTQCMNVIRQGGRVGMAGQGLAPATLAANNVSYREIDLFGIRGSTPTIWRRSGRFLSNNAALVAKLVTHRLPLSESVQAFDIMKDRTGVKVLLIPD